MNKIRFIFGLFLALLFLLSLSLAEPTERSLSQVKEKETQEIKNLSDSKIQPASTPHQSASNSSTSVNFILVTDVLDGFGGQRYNGGCDLSVFAGGQSTAIGIGSSTNFKLQAGFISSIVVLCGDCNGDGIVDVGDVVCEINYLFKGGPPPDPYEAGDVNCDGVEDVGDIVYKINYLFKGGSAPIC